MAAVSYFRVRDERARQAVQTLAPLQIDRRGNRTMPLVEQLAASERLRRQVGQIAVPLGLCTEPSNVKARGHGCDYRYRCVGSEHFRTDPSNQVELREYCISCWPVASASPPRFRSWPTGRAATRLPATRRSPRCAR